MEYDFTFIITFRYSSDRIYNLRKVISWINSFGNVQLIVVEQDTHSKIDHLTLDIEHIFVKSDRLFNKSWGLNVGLSYAKSDKIVFSDADIIMNPIPFIKSLNLLDKYDMVSPYSKVVDLSLNESILKFDDIYKIDRKGRFGIDICGGITMFTKQAIYKIGGWNENFYGWGGEDDLQATNVKEFLKWTETNANAYHYYHKRSIDRGAYMGNLNTLSEYRKLDKQTKWNIINNSRGKNGRLNKFS